MAETDQHTRHRARTQRLIAALPLAAILGGGCALTKPPTTADVTPVAKIDGEPSGLTTAGTDLSVEPGKGISADALYTILVAELAGQRGRIEIALDNYMKLMRAIPSAQLAERATRVAAYAEQQDATMEGARRWVQLDSRNLEARQMLAAALIRGGNLDEALVHLNYVLTQAEGEPAQRMWAVANLLSREQDKKVAVDIMEKLIDQHGRTPESLFAYALLAIRAEQPDKARAAMDQMVDFTPASVAVAVAYVGVLQKQGETASALQWLETVLTKHPEQHELRLVYARLLADDKQFEQAHKEFKILEKTRPTDADVQYALGLLELQSGRSRKARPYFERLVEIGEHADESRFYLGQIAEANKDNARARKWYEEVNEGELRLESKLRVALMLAREHKIEEAQKYLHDVEPQSDTERTRLIRAEGEILTDAGQLQAAMKVYDRALKDNYDSELLYTRAMLAEKMNRLDVLERDLRQILEREPDNSQALNALGYTLADRTTRYEEAYKLIQRALELAPNDFYILDSMGWVLYRLGRLDEAIAHLLRARALRDDPEVAAHLAEVLVAKGDKKQAAGVIASSLKNSPEDKRLLQAKQKLGL